MSLLSKIRATWMGLSTGRVTVSYPRAPRDAPERFRGLPVFDPNKCIGCAGCANHCPARAILVLDLCQELRILKHLGERCTYCGRCAEVCPEKAVTLSHEFETATNATADLQQRLELFMSTCQRCGRCFPIPSAIDPLKLKGYRCDDLVRDRWVNRSEAHLSRDPTVADLPIEVE